MCIIRECNAVQRAALHNRTSWKIKISRRKKKKLKLFWNPNEALWKAISLSLNEINKTINGIHFIIAILKLIAKS